MGQAVEQSLGQRVWELSYPHPNVLTLLGLGIQRPWGRCLVQHSPALPARARGHRGLGWLEAPTTGPSGMGSGSTSMRILAQQMCQWMWMHQNEERNVALAFGSPQLLGSLRMRHMMVHLPQGVKHTCPLHVPPTSKSNSKDKNEGF